MMRQTSDELVSLNETLNSEFTVQELEERLETDPLMLATPLDVATNEENIGICSGCLFNFSCGEKIKN